MIDFQHLMDNIHLDDNYDYIFQKDFFVKVFIIYYYLLAGVQYKDLVHGEYMQTVHYFRSMNLIRLDIHIVSLLL